MPRSDAALDNLSASNLFVRTQDEHFHVPAPSSVRKIAGFNCCILFLPVVVVCLMVYLLSLAHLRKLKVCDQQSALS